MYYYVTLENNLKIYIWKKRKKHLWVCVRCSLFAVCNAYNDALYPFHACVIFLILCLSSSRILIHIHFIWRRDRFQKRNIESITINKAKEMIDIDNVISFNDNNNKNHKNNNSNAQPTLNGASSVVNMDKISSMPFVATTMPTTIRLTTSMANHSNESNNNYSSHHIFETSASYANAFNIETIVLLFMFIVCTIIYSSKYQISFHPSIHFSQQF